MTIRFADRAFPGLPDPVAEPQFYAGVNAKRFVAWLFDATFIMLFCLLLVPFTAFTAVFFFPLLWLVTGFLYRWATLAGSSATWGMRMMSIELREADGLRLSGGTALVHTLGYSLSVAVAPLQLISVIVMVALGRGQGLTDLILGTAMINRPAA
jgi:uncharacterized RDD family membrane protein YckC